MTIQAATDPIEPVWWKQFWPWFLISFPATAVIAGIITINIAINSDDGLVSENYYKDGLAIHRDVNAVKRAKTLGIEATVNFDMTDNQVMISLRSTEIEAFGRLQLAFTHPTQAGGDSLIDLQAVGPNQYQGELPALPIKHWNLRLIASEAGWQLPARIDLGQQQKIIIK